MQLFLADNIVETWVPENQCDYMSKTAFIAVGGGNQG